MMYNHILIATDGSDLAQRGVDHGLSLAKALGSKVTILTATEPFPIQGGAIGSGWIASPTDYERYDQGQKEFAASVLSAARNIAGKQGVKVETLHVADVHPATAILEAVASRDCDLIVMASHGRRGIGRLLLGSQTSEVLAHSHTPVLVVR
jgi:nucleotide-binding universal stress UspA family protein